ncbi:hypothetical protein [Mycoplasma suis]|uniref:Uncharacterized protein n=2 Tax=Mycoplasma suis TaxID=57372 RepID=F0QQT9_MYCSL|nr:hypothetical protein [Mycoplasma suis]ADX97859.1 hypothetical protein MSU_0317 [Mycoplasma suis str. Illinois]CBZ40359.1 hypothetical protein MSUIS_02660 [Mycoplasma suis KI3806]
MVALKLLGILAASAGVGFPLVSSLKETSFPSAKEVTNKAKSAIKVKWVGKGSEEELGLFLNGLGKVIDSPNIDGNKGKEKILGLELQSWGIVDKDICKNLGLSGSGAILSGVSCEKSVK